jgi:hypothetical protein
MKNEPKQRTGKGNNGWPVRLAFCESAIRKKDRHVFKGEPLLVDAVVDATAVRVKANRQSDALEVLCKESCPRRELLYLLGMCENRGVANASKMTSYDSQELRTKLRDIRECADSVSRLNGHSVRAGWGGTEFGKFLEIAAVEVAPSPLAKFLELPSHLREYASLVDHASRYLGGKSDFYLHLAKALLAHFVHQQTEKYHDAEVATLLSVMLGTGYGEVNHRIWRSKYQNTFSNYQPDPTDSQVLRAKKTLLECEAAVFYRMDALHPGERYIRKKQSTFSRNS